MSQDKEREALLHYKRVYGEIAAILACRAEMPPPSDEDEITVQRLKSLVKECDDYADSCASKADQIDRLGEIVERLSAENKELRAALASPPPAAGREPLTDEQLQAIYRKFMLYQDGVTPSGLRRIARPRSV